MESCGKSREVGGKAKHENPGGTVNVGNWGRGGGSLVAEEQMNNDMNIILCKSDGGGEQGESIK